MGAIVTLEDGSKLRASSLGMDGALHRIAEAIKDIEPRLARWLVDKGGRPGGCQDFDLNHLRPSSRASFWIGVEKAYARYAEWDQEASFRPAVAVIRMFFDMRSAQHTIGRSDALEIDPDLEIDLDEDLWSDVDPWAAETDSA